MIAGYFNVMTLLGKDDVDPGRQHKVLRRLLRSQCRLQGLLGNVVANHFPGLFHGAFVDGNLDIVETLIPGTKTEEIFGPLTALIVVSPEDTPGLLFRYPPAPHGQGSPVLLAGHDTDP
jgi:hypothetical protein